MDSDKRSGAVGGFSNILRDATRLKVADFGLSLPVQDSTPGTPSNSSIRSTESLRTKPPKGSSCKLSIALHQT